MAIEGYRFVRVLLPEDVAVKCDSYRYEHHISWDALAEIALTTLLRPKRRGRSLSGAELRAPASGPLRTPRGRRS
jgi:hypothetical protein